MTFHLHDPPPKSEPAALVDPLAKSYLVALRVGGIMEDPKIHYEAHQVIRARTPDDAVNLYNTKNSCSYFYGHCLGEIIGGKISLPIEHLGITP